MFVSETDGKRKNQGLNPGGDSGFFFLAILSRSRVGPTQMEPLPPEINNKEFQLSSQQNLVPNIKEDQNYN